jgi:hypothetical protein
MWIGFVQRHLVMMNTSSQGCFSVVYATHPGIDNKPVLCWQQQAAAPPAVRRESAQWQERQHP